MEPIRKPHQQCKSLRDCLHFLLNASWEALNHWVLDPRVPFLALLNVKSQTIITLPWNTEFQL